MCQDNSTFQKKLGLKINELRLKQGLSYQELAYRSDIEKSNLVRIINNSQNPTIKTVYKISKGLNIPIHILFTFCTESENCNIALKTSQKVL